LPSFLLNSNKETYLGKKGTNLQVEEQMQPKDDEITGVKVINGITITKRWANEGDTHDIQENFLNRDLTHLTSNPKILE